MQAVSRWVIAAMVATAVVVTVSASTPPDSAAAQAPLTLPLLDPPTPRTWYTPLVPARLLDTRPGMATIDGGGRPGTPLGAGQTLGIPVLGRAGIPAAGVSAVVLNVTATNPTASSYLTVFPHGVPRPLAANLNFEPGLTRPNLVVAKVGVGGLVDVYNFAGQVDVVADVAGYVPATDGYVPLVPARLFDSRFMYPTIDGKGGGGTLGPGGVADVEVLGRGGIPADGVDSVVLNVTVTNVVLPPSVPSFLTVYPSIVGRPTAANLNFFAGQTVGNSVIVKVGPASDPISRGRIRIYNHAGTVDVVVDVAGYFATGGTFVSVVPDRIFETRQGEFIPPGAVNRGQPIGPDQAIDVQVTGRAGVPDFGVSAVVLNVTAIKPTGPSYLTVFPTGTARPNAANLNVRLNDVVPNLVVAKVGAGGKVSIYNYTGRTDLVIDVAGYFEAETGAIRDVDAADGSTCALFEVGSMWCWGGTPQDPVGTYRGESAVRLDPYEINTVDDAVDIAVGNEHTCVVRVGGTVWCWAAKSDLNLAGNGAPGEWVGAWPQIPVALPLPAVEIDAVYGQTCALLIDSTVRCWGRDYGGGKHPVPWQVGNLDDVIDISMGTYTSCGVRADGTVRCWGFVLREDLTSFKARTSAMEIPGVTDADSVSIGGYSCVTRMTGGASCWGFDEGGPAPTDIVSPNDAPVGEIVQVVSVQSPPNYWSSPCVLRSDGRVSCGFGTLLLDPPIGDLPPVVYLATGQTHTCAITVTNDLYCWGRNGQGQLGDGTLVDRATPQLIISSS